MVVSIAARLKACCVAVGLLLVTASAAEPVSPLIGITREQLLSRRGEPRSQLVTGSRAVYLYPNERVVLRDNVVIEVELLAPEPEAPRATPPAAAAPAEAEPAGDRAAPVAPAPAPTDPKLEIKLVRPPSKDGRPAASEPARPVPSVRPTTLPEPAATPPPVVEVTPVPQTSIREEAPPPVSKQPRPAQPLAVPEAVEEPAQKTSVQPKQATPPPAAPAPNPVAPIASSAPPPAESPPSGVFGVRTYALALLVLGVVIFLYWRLRQRKLELAASSVENTPIVTASTPVFTGTNFSAELVGQLEWKRFEELVAAYYNKTGVVAARTRNGPASPVHIKITWKGESRPFAYVQCIARPSAPVDLKPLQTLVAALDADNIRRGYVVTAGKFSAAVRDYAAEKHLTLLSGDMLIEKLNALPVNARSEIMQAVSAGDYTVPSCPECEASMVRSPGNPALWQCPKHPEQRMAE